MEVLGPSRYGPTLSVAQNVFLTREPRIRGGLIDDGEIAIGLGSTMPPVGSTIGPGANDPLAVC